eukprot:scaffold114338_cov55-Attheya_sp.AAC.1
MGKNNILVSLLIALTASCAVPVTAFTTRAFVTTPNPRLPTPVLHRTKTTVARAHLTQDENFDKLTKHRSGGWLPRDSRAVANYIEKLRGEAAKNPQDLVEPVQTLGDMIKEDKAMLKLTNEMFNEAAKIESKDPLGNASVKDLDEFLSLLNVIVTNVSPEFTLCKNETGSEEACGLIGFPINALLDWPMATPTGYVVFSNELINQQFKKILMHWAIFLSSKESTYSLTKNDSKSTPIVVGWLSDYAKKELVKVAAEATGSKVTSNMTFEQIFQCDPSDPTYGYQSWDEYFTRLFQPNIRPVAFPDDDNVVVSACEAAPLQISPNVKLDDKFWLKKQPYSLQNMMNFHPDAHKFVGGTVYQGFLSALSFHRWNSPVNGKIVDAFVVEG